MGVPSPHYNGAMSIKTEPIDANRVESHARFNGSCNYCHKKGHKKANCFKLKREQNQNYNNGNNTNKYN